MKKLPNFVKWLIIAVVLAAMAAMMVAVNDRALSKKPLTKICSASSAYSGCSVTTMMLQRGCSFWIMRVKASPFMPGISRLRKAASIGP